MAVRPLGFRHLVVGVAALLALPSFARAASPSTAGAGPPQALTVSGMAAPIGLGSSDVYFGWHVNDSRRGATQTSYRIIVSGPKRRETPVRWDSGRVSSADQAFVAYAGPSLAADTTYRWTVQTWDGYGRPSPFATPTTFDTGLQDADWHAEWIKRFTVEPTDSPGLFALQSGVGVWLNKDEYSYVRKETILGRSPIVRARAYVSADQQYELYVNGTLAGKGEAYQFPDSQYYEAQDITALLRPGTANAFGIVYGWQGPGKGRPAGTPGVIAHISVLHQDGSVDVITTDQSWRVLPGAWLPGTQRDEEGDPVDYTENINGLAVPVGWDRPGYFDAAWLPAAVIGPHPVAPWTHLIASRTRIVYQPVHPVALTRLASGAIVADFGKVYAAIPSVSFHRGVPAHLVTMRAGYLLDKGGEVSLTRGTQHTDMSYSYIQRGRAETFRPFDYLGFRYFQIDDPGETLTLHDVVALSRHTAVPDEHAASFVSSDRTVDAIFELGRHSALFSMQEQFVDTPTREKGSWLWDGHNESETAMDAFGDENLTRKDLLEFAQSQARYWPDGQINKIYPTALGALQIPQFTEIYPDWVWQYWMHTGDRPTLTTLYPSAAKVSDFLWRSVGRWGLIGPLSGATTRYPTDTTINLLAVNVFNRAGDMAAALGRPTKYVVQQRHRASTLTAAINARLLLPSGHYSDGLDVNGSPGAVGSQSTSAYALQFGVVPITRVAPVANYVATLGMSTAPMSAADVLDALRIAGRDDAIVRVLTNAAQPGWANILARGATFTWEVWNPNDTDLPVPPLASLTSTGDSMSHGWGSNVLVAIQQALLGVVPTTAGFATFEVTPALHALQHAAGRVPTPHGPIDVAWSDTGGRFHVDVTVPANTSATIRVPTPDGGGVTEGGNQITARMVGGYAVIGVGAGTYHFVSNA